MQIECVRAARCTVPMRRQDVASGRWQSDQARRRREVGKGRVAAGPGQVELDAAGGVDHVQLDLLAGGPGEIVLIDAVGTRDRARVRLVDGQGADLGRDVEDREHVVAGAGAFALGCFNLDRIGAAGRQREAADRRDRLPSWHWTRSRANCRSHSAGRPDPSSRDGEIAGFVPPPPGLSCTVIDSPAVP